MSNLSPYIVRRAPRNGVKVRHYITERLHVSRVDETRSTGRTLGGMFREVEATGRKVKGILRIQTGSGVTFDGHGNKGSHSDHVRTTPAAEIKKTVRRMRQEELDLLAGHDAEIAALEETLKDARARRAATVAEAWTKAHVVTVKELETLADLPRGGDYALSAEDREALQRTHNEIRSMFAGK